MRLIHALLMANGGRFVNKILALIPEIATQLIDFGNRNFLLLQAVDESSQVDIVLQIDTIDIGDGNRAGLQAEQGEIGHHPGNYLPDLGLSLGVLQFHLREQAVVFYLYLRRKQKVAIQGLRKLVVVFAGEYGNFTQLGGQIPDLLKRQCPSHSFLLLDQSLQCAA